MQNKKNKNGFTLIEILVVIAIVGILTSITVVNMGKNSDRDVNLEKDRFISFLRYVQNKALSAEKVSGATAKVCGIGVKFIDSSTAQIFYVQTQTAAGVDKLDIDCSSTAKTYDTSSYSNSSSSYFPDNTNPEVFKLANNVTFQSSPYGDVFFQIPNGGAYYNGVTVPNPGGSTLTLTKTDSSITATANVIVQSSGLIQ